MKGALSAQLWPGLNLYANESCLEKSNSNLFIAHLRHLLHLIGYEEGQPDWSQDYRIGTNGNCYKILIYAIFQRKGDSRRNWPLSAETLITCQQWQRGYIFNIEINDKIREIALQLYCIEITLKGEASARLKWIYGLYKRLKKNPQGQKNADIVAIDFKQICAKQQNSFLSWCKRHLILTSDYTPTVLTLLLAALSSFNLYLSIHNH